MSDERYVIVASGERFVFTRDQIESDPGNYFAVYFFGEFAEGSRGIRELVVEKEPFLFKLIQAHLRGYEIFPLPDSRIPSYMTKEVTITNLLREAQFYTLGRLEDRINTFQRETSQSFSLANAHANPETPIKMYKFAKHGSGRWVANNITQEGYRIILARISGQNNKSLVSPQSLICPGFTLVICWNDSPGSDISALLESK